MRYLRIVVVLLLSVTGSTASADALLDRARALHDSGNAQQAWELLAPLNAERAGIVEYDYLLGVVALDTGRRTEAIFAFERVLAVEPGHAEARAEIGRAYFELNELQRAKIQFDQVLQEDSVPDAARRQIGIFLSAIEAIETDVKTDWKAYVSFALGSDDNVNSGPSSSQIAVPLFGGAIVALDDSALPEESSFTQTRARFDLLHKFNAKAQLLAGAAIAQRSNYDSDAEAFDTSSIDFNFGFRYLRSESNHLLVSLQGQDFKLDGDAYRDVFGLLAQWRYRISSNREISLYSKLSELEFDDQSARDADRRLFGGGLSQFFPGKRNPLLYFGLYSGTEETEESASSHLGYDFIGMRIGAQTKLSDRSIIFSSISWENRDYDGTEPFFLKTREDKYISANLGLRYEYNQQFSIAPEIFWSENDSNIDLNENDKTSYSVTARYEF